MNLEMLDDEAILELRAHDAPQCRCKRGLFPRGSTWLGQRRQLRRYATSRSVALLVTVLIAMGVRSARQSRSWGIAMTSVQAFDGAIGALARDPSKTFGPFAFAVLNALTVAWLLRGQGSHPETREPLPPVMNTIGWSYRHDRSETVQRGRARRGCVTSRRGTERVASEVGRAKMDRGMRA